jgi:isopenicillin N synthase-like dioxygenase
MIGREEEFKAGSVLVNRMDPIRLLSALEHRGYFILPLSSEMLETQEEMFKQFEMFDSRPLTEKVLFSLVPDATGENNGWHGAGGLSRYNQCREGIIFQASSAVWPMLSDQITASSDSFSEAHEIFRNHAHSLAGSIMAQLATALGLPDPETHFTSAGPLDVIEGSQFHVKKVMLSAAEDISALHKTPEEDKYLTLRAHRDPSVISIVFHKRRLPSDSYGLGLQFKDPDVGSFVNIPIENGMVDEGGAICVVIAGSILEVLSEGELS